MSVAATETRFRFFDLELVVRTDVEAVADYCVAVFGRFRGTGGRPLPAIEILTETPGRWRVRDGTVDGTVERREWLEGFAAARILETVSNEVTDHELFHGGALSSAEGGIVLCGASGYGKSTLTLTLLSRGFRFLSDEIAAVDAAGRLVPFPKAIETRPGTEKLLGIPRPAGPHPRGKGLHDAGELFGGCLGESCPMRVVVILDDDRPKTSGEDDRIRLVVHGNARGLSERLAAVEGFRGYDWGPHRDGGRGLDIYCDRAKFPAWRLDETLAGCGLLVLDASTERDRPSTFDRPARIERLDAAEGVRRLLLNYRGSRALVRRIDERGGFAAHFVELVERLGGVGFYRLAVGRLDSAVEVIEGLPELKPTA